MARVPMVEGRRLLKKDRVWILRRMHELLSKGWTMGNWKSFTWRGGVLLPDGKHYKFCIRGAADQAFIERFGLARDVDSYHSAKVCEALSIEALARAKARGASAMAINDDPYCRRKCGLPGSGRKAVLDLVDEKLAQELGK